MNDLNQIIRNNETAGAGEAASARAAGKHVVSTYAGISYLTHRTFESREAAKAYSDELAKTLPAGERVVFQEPQAPAAHLPSAPATLASLQAASDAKAAAATAVTEAQAA